MTATLPVPGAAAPVEIDLPEGWVQGESGPHALLAHPAAHGGPVRPMLVVSRTAEPGPASLDGYAATQVAGMLLTFGGHVVHADVRRRPIPAVDLAFAVEQWGADLTVVQRHLWSDDRAVVATGSAADADWPALSASIIAAVRSLRPAGRAAGVAGG